MEYRVLGPLQVLAAGHPSHVGGLRSQRILAMFVMNANRVVSVDRLVDAAWGEDPPPSTARRQIQNRVAALRAMLAPYGTCPLTHAAGYSLAVGPDELDAGQFDRLVASAAACGEPAQRIGMLRSALALWRGPALDGLDSPVLTPAAELLDERRLQVLSDYFRLQLGAGCSKEVIPELTRLKSEHPLREEFLVQWMLAVSAVGRKAEALKVYHEFRSRIIEQIGIEPGHELQQAYLSLLRERPTALTSPAETAGPAVIRPVLPVVPRQLPRPLPSFVARECELTALSARLAHSTELQVVIVHGPGGIGKTALALHAAHARTDRFPDGQLFVNLHGFTPGRKALPAANALGGFLRALGLRGEQIPSDLDEASSLFRSVTAGRRILLVLDNARGPDQVMPLLPGSASCAVIVTSRNALSAIDGAHRFRLRPLSARDALVKLAQEVGADLITAEPAAAADIARFCGYMPLALQIASSGLQPAMTLHSLASRLADANYRLDHLELPESGVRATISASHQVLRASTDPVDKLAERALVLLSLLDGPDVSQAVAKALLPESDALVERAFDRLAEASLIDVLESGRYRIHDLVRLYGREQVAHDAPRAHALTRAFDVYVATAWNAAALIRPGDHRLEHSYHRWSGSALEFPDVAAALDWSETERENIMAAIRQAESVPNIPAVIPTHLASAMFGFFLVRGYWDDAIEAARIATAAAHRAGDFRAEARLLSDAGRALAARGSLPEAVAHVERAMRCQRKTGDREGLAQSLTNMGVVYYEGKRLDDALGCLLDSLSIHQELHNLRGQAVTLNNIGPIYRIKGLYGKALDCHDRAISIFEGLHDSHSQALALRYLGELYLETRRFGKSVAYLEQSLSIYRRVGDRHGEAESLLQLGSALRSQQ